MNIFSFRKKFIIQQKVRRIDFEKRNIVTSHYYRYDWRDWRNKSA